MELNDTNSNTTTKTSVEDTYKNLVDDTSPSKEKNNDPYAYLDRDDFTSEKYKIEIRSLPKFYGIKEVKKLLNSKLQLNCTKIKAPSLRSSWIYACFRSEEDKGKAMKVLNNYPWKNALLRAEEAKPVPDPLVQKRLQDSSGDVPNKKQKLECNVSESMKNVTTPLWKLPYDEQLKKKKDLAISLLRSYSNKILGANPQTAKWLKEQRKKYNEMPCEVLPIRHAEQYNGYRNKCEFTAGINDETGVKTIGFRLSSYCKGSVSVAPIDDALNVPKQMKTAVIAFQKFVQNSELDVYSPELHTGYWRQLTARYGFRTGQLMLIVGITPQKMTDTEIGGLKNKIKEYFVEGEGKSCNVTSLYLEQIKVKTRQDNEAVHEHIFGETHITEKLLGRTFRISPQAFFQVNTLAAEILYKSIDEVASLTPDVTLLDVCCGTGTIGICLADKCGEVLGLEISQEAIEDAKQNMSSNNVTNAQFFAGKAEDILSCVAHKATKDEIIAIVDPPRAGLQQDALVQLRKCEKIKKLVYVSCNPRGAIKNFVDLGRAPSKIYRGEPFLPVKAMSVDMFPHTHHCELIIYFERQQTSK